MQLDHLQRAQVVSADGDTGDIAVTLMGYTSGGSYMLSKTGRFPSSSGQWSVPVVGTTIWVYIADRQSHEVVWVGASSRSLTPEETADLYYNKTESDARFVNETDSVTIPDLPAMTVLAANDLIIVSDTSNTTDAPSGSASRITMADFLATLPGPLMVKDSGTTRFEIANTGLVTISGSSDEKLRILAGTGFVQGFISWYDAAGSTRLGYLTAATGHMELKREGNAYLDLTANDSGGAIRMTANAGIAMNGGGGAVTMSGSLVVVNPIGIQYPGATAGGGTPNSFGFRWSSPNLIGVVDNVVYATVGTASDRRLKADITDWDGGDIIDRLHPVSYLPRDYTVGDDGKLTFDDVEGADRHCGLIADEVEQVAPWVVSGEASDTALQSVDYAALVTPLISRVQHLSATVTAQAERIAALEARLLALEASR